MWTTEKYFNSKVIEISLIIITGITLLLGLVYWFIPSKLMEIILLTSAIIGLVHCLTNLIITTWLTTK